MADDEILELLNEHLTAELTGVNQYFLDAKMLENWGLPGLAKLFRDRSFDEMRDTEELIERVLYLGGHPNLQRLDNLRIGETPVEMIELGLEFERDAIARLQRGIDLAGRKSDHGTRTLLETMLREEEEHADYFESQLEAIEMIGEQTYLARYTLPEST
jgi:bacterioferritin